MSRLVPIGGHQRRDQQNGHRATVSYRHFTSGIRREIQERIGTSLIGCRDLTEDRRPIAFRFWGRCVNAHRYAESSLPDIRRLQREGRNVCRWRRAKLFIYVVRRPSFRLKGSAVTKRIFIRSVILRRLRGLLHV